jgi:thiol-disulfide isomerase/thioredoxin
MTSLACKPGPKNRLPSRPKAVALAAVLWLAPMFIFHLTALAQAKAIGSSLAPEAQTNGTITVHVQTADGAPLPGLTVVFVNDQTNAALKGTRLQGGIKQCVTGADGGFALPARGAPVVLVTASEQGFSLAESRDLQRNPVMIVQAWGRIEGLRMNRNRPVADARISISPTASGFDPGTVDSVDMNAETTTDARGHFVFEHVPPLDINLSESVGPERMDGVLAIAAIEPGAINRVNMMTEGRTVTGHIVAGDDLAGWTNFPGIFGVLDPDAGGADLRLPRPPRELDSAGARLKWCRDYYNNTETGRQIRALRCKARILKIHPDGSFIGVMAEPGPYRLIGSYGEKGLTLAEFNVPVVIPAIAPEAGDEPLDLGKIVLHAVKNLKPGDPAPDFSVATLDNQPLKLSDFRGKFVLLDFWATWCGPCIAEMPNLKATYDAFAGDKRFVMVSLSLDSNREAPKKFVAARNIHWAQAFVGDSTDGDLAKHYVLTTIPKIFLVGPDGKLVACYLRGAKIQQTVASALAR